ncbi:1,6-anhydro-N-acetylmuramyl-L-alanine amidase AmpD [Exilibacterium tricleocarpae]|uniref:1,6-anhydro-N-acetylmuramyl-L-alanine amidase AmpD n=1 Tax=Exilibacterium tricleocarpae TaxID=2591008 RepID=UPI001FE3E228|nr:1,6-anhydro-N-acetylmuramyl-L-alanine amidase AmpD [Exilibacterium tricleocarpae]
MAVGNSTYTIDKRGWLRGVQRVVSPNFNRRPPGASVSLLVIHSISLPPGRYGGGHIERFFTNSLDLSEHPYFQTLVDLRVSAHLLIARDGGVTQFVSCFDRAWHAGASCYQQQDNCNDFSIGIELEGTDVDAYTDEQYRELAAVTRALLGAFPELTPQAIAGHSDIAPGRKTDPGAGFDWRRYRADLV